MESTRVRFLFTSCEVGIIKRTSEALRAKQWVNTFHGVFCLLYAYWDIYYSGKLYANNCEDLTPFRNRCWIEAMGEASECVLKCSRSSFWAVIGRTIFSRVKSVVRGLSLARTHLRTNFNDMAFSWVPQYVYNKRCYKTGPGLPWLVVVDRLWAPFGKRSMCCRYAFDPLTVSIRYVVGMQSIRSRLGSVRRHFFGMLSAACIRWGQCTYTCFWYEETNASLPFASLAL